MASWFFTKQFKNKGFFLVTHFKMCKVFIYTPHIYPHAPGDTLSAYDIHPHVVTAMLNRNSSLNEAQFVFYNFSLTFRGRNRYAAFDHLSKVRTMFAPKPVIATYFMKDSRIRGNRPSKIPGIFWLFEMETGSNNIIAPFHFAPSAFLESRTLDKNHRKTLFFCGHIPKLYISPMRFQMWSQLVRAPDDATVCSHTLVRQGVYANCHHPNAWYELKRQLEIDMVEGYAVSPHNCRTYARFNFYSTIKMAGRRILPRFMNTSEFFSLEMAHDFCLVVPGDYPSTPKIGETLIASALGGCIPVLVKQSANAIPYYSEYSKCAVQWRNLNASSLLLHLKTISSDERRRLRQCAVRLAPKFLYETVGGISGKAGDALVDTLCTRLRS